LTKIFICDIFSLYNLYITIFGTVAKLVYFHGGRKMLLNRSIAREIRFAEAGGQEVELSEDVGRETIFTLLQNLFVGESDKARHVLERFALVRTCGSSGDQVRDTFGELHQIAREKRKELNSERGNLLDKERKNAKEYERLQKDEKILELQKKSLARKYHEAVKKLNKEDHNLDDFKARCADTDAKYVKLKRLLNKRSRLLDENLKEQGQYIEDGEKLNRQCKRLDEFSQKIFTTEEAWVDAFKREREEAERVHDDCPVVSGFRPQVPADSYDERRPRPQLHHSLSDSCLPDPNLSINVY
jgi:hypothetical protein